MVWQEDARTIVMITKEIERGRVKFFNYYKIFLFSFLD